MSEAKVVEIDAIAVEEWDSEQHTPVHAESNLAELVKKSGLDAGWDVPTKEEASVAALADKPRTTVNTMRRTGAAPAMPSKVHKTMAMPTVAAVKPAPPVAKGTETKAAVTKSATKTTATGVTPVVAAAPPAAPAKPAAKSPTKTTATGVTPVVAAAPPAAPAKPAAKSPTKTTATGVTPVVAAAPPAAPAKPAAKSPTKTTATGVAPVVAAAPTFSPFGNETAAAKPVPVATVPAKSVRADATPPPVRVEATPGAAKAPRKDATPPPSPVRVEAAAKPARTDATPPPMRSEAAPAKPERIDPPPASVRVEATPSSARADATPAKPARVPEVLTKPAGEAIAARLAAVAAPARAPSTLDLPAWPPSANATKDFEDWDELGGATSVGTQDRSQPPREPGDDSVIVDLNAEPKAEKPKLARALSQPITSEQGTATSGAFVMPTADQPVAQLVVPVATPVTPAIAAQPVAPPSSRSEKPTSPAIPIAAAASSLATQSPANSSTAWHTPLPLAAPPPEPAPQWPSAAGLDYGRAQGSAPEIPVPARQEPTEPRLERSSLLATVLPTPKSRKKALLIAAGALAVILVVVMLSTGGSAKATTGAPTAQAKRATPNETAPASSTASAATPAAHSMPDKPATAAAVTTVATADPVATPAPTTKKPIVAKRRISRGKKPVVVDYDKKPDPTPEQDEALTRARADYAAGNRHLFAGEAAAAIVSYRQALAAYPNYVAGYRGLGLAFAQEGNKASALDAFKTYVKLAPTAKDVSLIQKRIANLSVR